MITHAGGKEKLDAYLILANLYMAEARDKLKVDTLFSLYDAEVYWFVFVSLHKAKWKKNRTFVAMNISVIA